MDYKDRIKAARRQAKLTQAALGERAGITQASISELETGKSLGTSFNARIAKACGVSALWLENGIGTMAPGEQPGDESASPSTQDYALIPRYSAKGPVGVGDDNEYVELQGGLVFKRDWLASMHLNVLDLYVLYAEGQSMEPTIAEGEVLLIDTSKREPQNRNIYAISRPGGGNSVKRLIQPFDGSWIIRCDSTDKARYPDEPISSAALQQIEIIGRAVWRGGGI